MCRIVRTKKPGAKAGLDLWTAMDPGMPQAAAGAAERAFTRAARRETLREAVFL